MTGRETLPEAGVLSSLLCALACPNENLLLRSIGAIRAAHYRYRRHPPAH